MRVQREPHGEVPGWANGIASTTVVPITGDRGFESLCIREDAVLGPIFDSRVGHRWGDHLAAMVDASRVGPLRDGRLRSD